jgi:mannose-6-phosphate isomerase
MLDKISFLKNPVQHYAWGSTTAIQALLGEKAQDEPAAELWMGAHPSAPSEVKIKGKWIALNKAIQANPDAILGARVAEKFSNKLPFLFKVLAADRPLSIQVHPNLTRSREGFERENARGIPISAPDRNYHDENHKPEILCALSRFHGLKGFRPIPEILALMGKVSCTSIAPGLCRLRERPDPKGLRLFFDALMTMDRPCQEEMVTRMALRAETYTAEASAYGWVVKLNQEFPGDIGVLSPLILNVVELAPGEAMFLPAGELHAYLRGVGMELMANSDNVIRGGLTVKHMDVNELLDVVDFRRGTIQPIQPIRSTACEARYPVPVSEFLLSAISVKRNVSFTGSRERSVEIILCQEGQARIKNWAGGDILSVSRGSSVIVPACIPGYRIEGDATLYKASVP